MKNNNQIIQSSWWQRDSHEDRRSFLLTRMQIKSALRAWFLNQDFIEVEPACIQSSPGNETHLHAFSTKITTESGAYHSLYLHTSPEFACKKLLAAGEKKIFTFAPVFRNKEYSKLHHPEFTMLEWYVTDTSYNYLIEHCHEILKIAAKIAENQQWSYAGRTIIATDKPERIKLVNAFKDFAGIDIMATLCNNKPRRKKLADAAQAQGIRVAKDDTWSDIFSRIIVERIEPNLGNSSPVILDAYPLCESTLARRCPNENLFAERFELYCCGVELENAFGELTVPTILRQLFEANMAEKHRIYGERYPLDEDFLSALAEMPPASGCAMGFDRLVMLATGAQRIDQVIWTPLPNFA